MIWCAASAYLETVTAENLGRMGERRAVEAVIWGMPAVNFDLWYQAMIQAKGGDPRRYLGTAAGPTGEVSHPIGLSTGRGGTQMNRRSLLAGAAALGAAALSPNIAAAQEPSPGIAKKPNIVFILMDKSRLWRAGRLWRGHHPRRPDASYRPACSRRAAADQFQCRGAMHPEPLGHYDRALPDPLGNAVGPDRRRS